MAKTITTKDVECLGPGRHRAAEKLYLTVSKAEARSWVFLYGGTASRARLASAKRAMAASASRKLAAGRKKAGACSGENRRSIL